MKKQLQKIGWLCCLCLLAACQPKKTDKDVPYLFEKTKEQGELNKDKDPAFLKGVEVAARLELLQRGSNERYKVSMPDGKDIVIVQRRLDKNNNNAHWLGEVAGVENSFVSLTYTTKAVSGSMHIGKNIYRIAGLGKGRYVVAQLEPEKMTEVDDDGEVPKRPAGGGNPHEADGCPDPASDVDIMVVYTQAAEDGAGGPDEMEALIYECISLSNLCYENSDIVQRMRLVHFAKTTLTEAANSVTDREALRDPADGKMDEIHALRDAHGADIVILMLETCEPGNCGRAYIMDPVSAAHEDHAFGVVKRSCAVDNLSFPHEVGHIMSALHHDDASTTPFPYGHGFQATAPTNPATTPWRTVMSKIGGTVRIPWFSNPDLDFPATGATDAMGTADREDNHRVLNNTVATTANFRCSSPSVGNVWMKDSWNDTGLEPDPATAGESMWRSPYIWIRNEQDDSLLYSHLHQNPEYGQTNWVYVKLHNGNAAAQTGTLELYVADASASLTWPGAWTHLGDVPLTITGSSSTIAEYEWTTVPNPASGSSHYCMIARWNSPTDPMHTAEGADIGVNVRENNNIVWRNLNVVDATTDADSWFAVNVAALDVHESWRIVFEEVTNFPKPRWIPSGKVIIELDAKLAAAIAKGKNKPDWKDLGNNRFEMTSPSLTLSNLPRGYKGQVKLQFKKGSNTPRGKFDFSVKQYGLKGQQAILVGGVDYQIVNSKK